jgi:energy-coupling factor transport system permease protein
VGAAVVIMTVTRNPIYLALVLLWIAVVTWTVGRFGEWATPQLWSTWRFAAVVIPAAMILNALFVHVGSTRLFSLPEWIPLLGGSITLEALVYGALNGIVLTGIFAAFSVFNRVTPVRDLVQMAPHAYYPVAVTVAIAVTFVPVTLRQAERIREAQAVRGNRMRGLRSWLPIFVPLLSSGLERALQLAEAMVARGFASAQVQAQTRSQLLLIVGLVLVATGASMRLVTGAGALGAATLLAGGAIIVLGVWLAGRNFPHTVYRPAPWRASDWAVTALALGAAGLFLFPLPGIDRSSIYYTPYPTLTMPDFSVWLGLATWGLLGPAGVYAMEANS